MRGSRARWDRALGWLGWAGRWLLLAAVAVGLSLLLSDGRERVEPLPGESHPAALRPAATPVANANARPSPAGDEIYLDAETEPKVDATPAPLACIIEPYEVVNVGSPVRGRIEKLPVERGDSVSAGQVVAELDPSVERAQVESARVRARMDGDILARIASAGLGERKQSRARKLYASNAIALDAREEMETEAELARFELQRARESQQLARAELERAVAALEQRTIRSTISGVVTERRMAPGEVVDDQTILRVAQIDPLRVEVVLPAALFAQVRPGMRAAITPELSGDQVHIAEVKIVDRVIDAASGTFEVRLELPNHDGAIPGGLNCQVRFLDK